MEFKNKIIQGHALEVLKQMPAGSVHCCFTSPPYWALRDYKAPDLIWDSDNGCVHDFTGVINNNADLRFRGKDSKVGNCKNPEVLAGNKKSSICKKCGAWKGQLGLEPQYQDYIRHLADVFDAFRRVLTGFGTLWVNLGDTYSTNSGGMGKTDRNRVTGGQPKYSNEANSSLDFVQNKDIDLSNKSLINIPHRFAIEMTSRGWVHRQTIIWRKANSMPSSALDRFTTDFEFIFLFTKGTKTQYYTNEKTLKCTRKKPSGLKGIKDQDWEYIECQHCNGSGENKDKPCRRCEGTGKVARSLWSSHDYFFNQQFETSKTPIVWSRKGSGRDTPYDSNNPRTRWGLTRKEAKGFKQESISRNARTTWEMSFTEYMQYCAELWHVNQELSSIWKINTEPFSAAHFACFPRSLAKRPIDAGCPEMVCKKCGLPRVKIYRFTGDYDKQGGNGSKTADHIETSISSSLRTKKVRVKEFAGYSDCDCNAGYEPGIVCDPFAGSGTTLQVAKEMSRDYFGIEINPDYIEIANNLRLGQQAFNFNFEEIGELC